MLYKIRTLIPRIQLEWEKFTYGTKILVISGLVRSVVLSQVSSGWLKVDLIWKLPEWGIDTGYIRKTSSKASWTDEEDDLLRTLYPTESVLDILRAFPSRNWAGILEHASYRGIRRGLNRIAAMASVKETGMPINISLDDWEYAHTYNLSFGKNTQWTG